MFRIAKASPNVVFSGDGSGCSQARLTAVDNAERIVSTSHLSPETCRVISL